jgi:hypothetical protein
MIKGGSRICDICGDVIPDDEKFLTSFVPPEEASIFIETEDLELTPTWTPMDDGKIKLEICLDCDLTMGSMEAATSSSPSSQS